MAKNTEVIENQEELQTPVTFGSEENPTETTTSPSTDETPAQTEGTEEDAQEGGEAQATNMKTATVVYPNAFDEEAESASIPQTDTTKYANVARHITNGDFIEEDKSVVADKMVNEAHSFQTSKPTVSAFPATGAEYLETLDFKVSQ